MEAEKASWLIKGFPVDLRREVVGEAIKAGMNVCEFVEGILKEHLDVTGCYCKKRSDVDAQGLGKKLAERT